VHSDHAGGVVIPFPRRARTAGGRSPPPPAPGRAAPRRAITLACLMRHAAGDTLAVTALIALGLLQACLLALAFGVHIP
jgi:hypothetical protein